jgi:hypothetical protein
MVFIALLSYTELSLFLIQRALQLGKNPVSAVKVLAAVVFPHRAPWVLQRSVCLTDLGEKTLEVFVLVLNILIHVANRRQSNVLKVP